jgi:hypothetical protein
LTKRSGALLASQSKNAAGSGKVIELRVQEMRNGFYLNLIVATEADQLIYRVGVSPKKFIYQELRWGNQSVSAKSRG